MRSRRRPLGRSGQPRRPVQLLQTATDLHTCAAINHTIAEEKKGDEHDRAEAEQGMQPVVRHHRARAHACAVLTSAMASCDCLSLIAAGDGDGSTARFDASRAALAKLGSVPLIVRREAGVRSADCWPGARARLCKCSHSRRRAQSHMSTVGTVSTDIAFGHESPEIWRCDARMSGARCESATEPCAWARTLGSSY